jgi:RNA polymerase sigma-70 factor, ECF subfamily
VAAVQYLPARQRAALLLCDVLTFPAKQAAQVLDTSTGSVTSALQRARATLAATLPAQRHVVASTAAEAALVARYVAAWYAGRADVAAYLGMLFTGKWGGRLRLSPTRANSRPALAVYARHGDGHHPFALKVLTVQHGLITHVTGFADPDLFGWFDLPPRPVFDPGADVG